MKAINLIAIAALSIFMSTSNAVELPDNFPAKSISVDTKFTIQKDVLLPANSNGVLINKIGDNKYYKFCEYLFNVSNLTRQIYAGTTFQVIRNMRASSEHDIRLVLLDNNDEKLELACTSVEHYNDFGGKLTVGDVRKMLGDLVTFDTSVINFP